MILNDEQDEQIIALADAINELNTTWAPHEKQIEIGRALFYEGAKNIFVCAGRNFGKTELAAYCLWRYALENPGSENYVFEPFLKQAREILWAGGRIQNFGPKRFIESINNSELRLRFTNGSFIKLEGSDNEAAIAGIKPKGLIVYDELKDHREKSVVNFEPNRAAFGVPALFIGTPPQFDCYYVRLMELAQSRPKWKFFHAPSSSNPHLSREWLNDKRDDLIHMGDEESWLRDWEAKYIKGGRGAIFPQVFRMTFPKIDEAMPKDINKWYLVISFDPASTSVFAASFSLFNEYSKQVITFDELYEEDPLEMTAGKIYQKVEAKIKDLRSKVRGIRWVYDEAAAWFRNEIYDIPNNDWALEPSQKHLVGVEGYIAITRTAFNSKSVVITDNCVKTKWEYELYFKDEKGKIPKKNDHLINAISYKLQALGFNPEGMDEPKPPDLFAQKRGIRMEDEIPSNNNLLDFDHDFNSNQSLEEIDI